MRAPELTPVTRSNTGRVPASLQPTSSPAPKAPSSAPPDMARRFETGGWPLTRHDNRLDLPGRCISPKTDVVKSFKLDLGRFGLRQDIARGDGRASGSEEDC